jgi:hypothetical protein
MGKGRYAIVSVESFHPAVDSGSSGFLLPVILNIYSILSFNIFIDD